MNVKFLLLGILLFPSLVFAQQKPSQYSMSVVLASDHPAVVTGGAVEGTLIQGTKAPAATATPEVIVGTTTLVKTVLIRAGRTARVANTGSVWIGTTSTNDAQLIELVPGAYLSISAPQGGSIDLNKLYVDSVTLTDGVTYIAIQ